MPSPLQKWKVSPGEAVSSTHFNGFLADVEKLTDIKFGPGIRGANIGGRICISAPRQAETAAEIKQPFTLVAADDEAGTKVRVITSTLGGDVPAGFSPGDDPPYVLTVADADIVWGGITIDSGTGEITARWLDSGAEMPADTATDFHVRIGSVAVSSGVSSPVNDRYGPITATVCRNWFAAEAPYFGVTFG
jgi:hypothetical protein